MNLGNNLKVLRKSKNITQEELAEYIGVSPQTISKWENNNNMPDLSMLPILADFYRISIDELLQYDSFVQKEKMKNLSNHIHELQQAGKTEAAYEELKEQLGEWKLSAGINHLFASIAYQLSKEKQGEEKSSLLYEAIASCEKVVSLDQSETGRTAQAKMTICNCLYGLGRFKEAEKLAASLPSVFSSREIVLARITTGEKKKECVETAKAFLEELLVQLNTGN